MLTHEQACALGALVRAGKIRVVSVYNPETKFVGTQVIAKYKHSWELRKVLPNFKFRIYRNWDGDD